MTPVRSGPPSGGAARQRRAGALLLAGLCAALLAGCEPEESGGEAGEVVRPVRVATVVERDGGETIALSGTVEAVTEVDLAFRIGGRLVERAVEIGDTVEPGQPVARLDGEDELNALRAATADLLAAEGQLIEAEVNHERQAQLLERGFTTRQRYDEAAQVLRTIGAQVDAARARVEIARNRVDDTALYADAAGAVTERGAEPGEVVTAGQMIVRLARDGGRDAVFDVPPDVIATGYRDAVVRVSLSIDEGVVAEGRVREVSPQADPVTGSFRVRVGLIDPPAAMRLGSTVTGRLTIEGAGGLAVPSTALHRTGGQPAVWVVDTASGTVSLRAVTLAEHRQAEVTVESGLAAGEVVVTAGVQALRPGQRVRLLETPSS